MKRHLYRIAYQLIRVYWFIARPKTRGAELILHYKNEVLLVRHTYGKNLWRLPGGGVKAKESPQTAAIREAQEELGISLKKVVELGTTVFTDQFKHDTVWFFEAATSNKHFESDQVEIKESGWFPIDELPQPLSKSAWQGLQLFSPSANLNKRS